MTSDRERWTEIDRLFRGALELDADERSDWLTAECDDSSVRAEAERLLRSHDDLGDFLTALDTEAATSLVAETTEDDPDPESVGPYRIVRRLARGGMGVVYLARDERLDRSVAVKCLPSWLDTDRGMRQRFLAEARAASRIDHPHIATVHDVGETPDGGLYIAMSYYEGETLAERIARGPLEIAEALELAGQIAGALAAAHAVGIVHRDVKPANVIVTPDGRAKVLDFGIAKTENGQTTRTGVRLGTVAYMSPEQTRGEPVDARTDVWSFGALLYEALAGRRPFGGQDDAVVIHAIRHDDPPPLGELRPRLPSALVEIVERCLDREPSGRFRSAAELEESLWAAEPTVTTHRTSADPRRWSSRTMVIGGIAALGAILIGGFVVAGDRDAFRDPADVKPIDAPGAAPAAARSADILDGQRLAVLPLAYLEGPTSDEYLAAGLTDELMARLSGLDRLHVVGRTSIMTYEGTDKRVADIARELNVDAVLQGTLQRAGDRVRIDLQLVDGASEERLWSNEFDIELGDLRSVQAEIAERVVGALRLGLREGELPGFRERRPRVQEAYLSYLRGRYFWNERTPDALERARAEFRRALDLDPAYAEAWAGLSDTYWLLAGVGTLSPVEAATMARAAAERALDIDQDLAEAHVALATVLASYDWNWEGAIRHFERALASNPNYWIARHRYASLLAVRGRFDEAIHHARTAADLDPLSSYARAGLGYVLYLAGRHDEAIAHLEKAARLDPDFFLTHLDLALAYLGKGLADRAVAAASEASRLSGRYQAAVGVLGHAYAIAGRSAQARAILQELAEPPDGLHANPFNLGIVHLGLGEHDRAVDHFEDAASSRAPLAEYLGVDPILDGLRPDPRFQRILREHDLYVPALR